ncbi:Protein K09E4.2 b [Aphelenchoides avenae]|nr:Protein K09E4.2 b [Aphelenchus avenae]
MNILLFAPAVFFVLLANNGIRMTTVLLAICGFVQVLVAWPFLTSDPISYLKRAFELGRVFLFKWTVNWRFLPEELFVSKSFHLLLLALHFTALAVFGAKMWFRSQGGLMHVLTKLSRNIRTRLSVHDVLYALFTANFIGIAFARSLHYQFYCWYYHSLHYLLFSTISKSPQQVDVAEDAETNRVVTLLAVEVCWNTYPSTVFSSALLHVCHAAILVLLIANREGPTVSPSRKLH